MNLKFYYKGQVISVNINENSEIKKIYESSISKFDYHFSKELVLFSFQVRLRIKRNNRFLDWKDVASGVLMDDDLIIIEPKDSVLISNNQSCHAPKRYDISHIENNFASSSNKDSRQFLDTPPSLPVKLKQPSQNESGFPNRLHKYQKSDHSQNMSRENRTISNNFDRNGLRRSLGAAFAPQCDILSSRENNNFFGFNSNNAYPNEIHSSDSSISDCYQKPQNNYKGKPNKITGLTIKSSNIGDMKILSKSAPASPTKPAPPQRSPHTHLSMMNAHNVRTIGKKISLSILKKPNIGLGFTIVTRDHQVLYGSGTDITNSVVILVNKILKNGGAADDGRLIPGDRILEVNSVPVTSLKDTTEKLRAIPENTYVDLLISRVEKETPTVPVTSKLPKASSQLTFEISLNPKHKENQQLGLNILYRNENDSPSLGVGIYIHSILNNSLAAEQANLLVHDKLIGINGQSLANMNVSDTINLLKTAMSTSSVLSITVMREKTLDQLDGPTDNTSKSIPNLNYQESNVKPDLSHCLLPNKITLEPKPRLSKLRPESKTSINNNRYSSSDSGLQNENEEIYPYGFNAFEREGKGRRSMSEKGKVHDDATQFQMYKNRNNPEVNTDRQYSTLPTTSHRKKMMKQNDQSPPPLPNKTPMKPSQIKIKSAQESGTKSSNGTPSRIPNRSSSLRDSSSTSNTEQKSRSSKPYSQTPTHELPVFNRAMNNSFKKAVQRSLPDANEQIKTNPANYSVSHSSNKHYTNPDPVTPHSEKEYQNIKQSSLFSNKNQQKEKMPRSNSVKNAEKKKSFNIKDFLAFTPSAAHAARYKSPGKSDTFPPDKHADPQLPNYQSINTPDSKHQTYTPAESQMEFPYCNDQAIIDSTKRVIEWQKKNADVISKESKQNEKIYQPIHPQVNNDARIQKRRKSKPFKISLLACCSTTRKVDMNLRNTSQKKSANQYHYETDPYDTIDATLSSPSGQSKYKSSRVQSRSANNTYDISGAISKNGGTPRANSITPFQSNHPRKTTTIGNDVYATVNKSAKKESNNKKSTNISQSQKNVYQF